MADLHPTTHLQAAAWVPEDDPQRPWDEAADIAAKWIWERSAAEGVIPMLVTNTFRNAIGIASLDEIVSAGGQATPQGKGRFDRGPVLAYVPTERTLKLATDLAHGYSLVVVETTSFPIGEWASAAGAINLLDGSESVSTIPSDVKSDLDRAIFFGGNNGWTGSHEKQHARTVLSSHALNGRLDSDDAASYAMANGVSDKGAKRLRSLIEAMAR